MTLALHPLPNRSVLHPSAARACKSPPSFEITALSASSVCSTPQASGTKQSGTTVPLAIGAISSLHRRPSSLPLISSMVCSIQPAKKSRFGVSPPPRRFMPQPRIRM
ncbi:11K hypothetical protein [Strawberry mild yellow edge virus]|uniref:11K protein n=1 Tax=Strawberry mild yellow edge-associated virus TaxID=12187 RepID=Q88468_SMYEA|nr:11K hypothetical protein [Strawberry mild yellow edge virus]BAA02080.1 11K protein [Strawberry mild yellow edge virus]BAA02087.1 11K protein [Strawberry mild yellow edge virus]